MGDTSFSGFPHGYWEHLMRRIEPQPHDADTQLRSDQVQCARLLAILRLQRNMSLRILAAHIQCTENNLALLEAGVADAETLPPVALDRLVHTVGAANMPWLRAVASVAAGEDVPERDQMMQLVVGLLDRATNGEALVEPAGAEQSAGRQAPATASWNTRTSIKELAVLATFHTTHAKKSVSDISREVQQYVRMDTSQVVQILQELNKRDFLTKHALPGRTTGYSLTDEGDQYYGDLSRLRQIHHGPSIAQGDIIPDPG